MGETSNKRKNSPTKSALCAKSIQAEPSNCQEKKLKQSNDNDNECKDCGTFKSIENRLRTYEPVKNKLFARALWNRLSLKESAGNCEICDTGCERLNVTHLWDHQMKAELVEAYYKDMKSMPSDVDDVMNGLLLCPGCHAEFDGPERRLKIASDGTIAATGFIFDTFRKELNGRRVPWADEIDRNRHYPPSRLLKAVFTMIHPPRKHEREREEQLRNELLYEVCSGGVRGDFEEVQWQGQVLSVDWNKPLDDENRSSIVCGVVDCKYHCFVAARDLCNLPLCYQHASAQRVK